MDGFFPFIVSFPGISDESKVPGDDQTSEVGGIINVLHWVPPI